MFYDNEILFIYLVDNVPYFQYNVDIDSRIER